MTVEPGRTVALVGATASGKSTLATLLFRLVDPDRGRILLDGTDLRDLPAGTLAEHAALVPQATFLFDDTVRGNVTLGLDVDDADVWAALRVAQADGFVAALPEGLDTQLGERGTTLSGGQRQRLSLARALVRRPRLLVMDDATSAVDPEVESRILAALKNGLDGTDETQDSRPAQDTVAHLAVARGGTHPPTGAVSNDAGSARGADDRGTVVVVAYRKATIGLADEVVFLDGGRVADRGTHDELLERNPAYADLVNAYENATAEAAEAAEAARAGDDGATSRNRSERSQVAAR